MKLDQLSSYTIHRINSKWVKDSFLIKWCWENWTDTCRKIKLDQLLIPHTRILSKWNKDLSCRFETIKILEKNIGSKISNISHSNIFS